MGIAIVIPDASFSNYVDRDVPHIESAAGYWLLGGGASETRKNRVPGASVSEATIVGDPEYHSGYAVLNVDNYLDSGIVLNNEAPAFTFVSVASITTTVRQPLCGTWHSGINGAMLDRDPHLRFATQGSAAGLTPISDSTLDSIMLTAGVRDGESAHCYLHDGSTLHVESGSSGSLSRPPSSYRIGPSGGLGLQTTDDVQHHAANLLFMTALSQQQIMDLYEYFAFLLPRRGAVLL